ncbi:MAG: porin family protein [Balneolaceae bacterium]|nr:MAG: porin family protein [Balneolaceae bacterium]
MVESGYLLCKPQHSNRKTMNLQMKSIWNTLAALAVMLLMWLVVPVQQAHAVTGWGIGASYEIRDADPGNGFGLRLERGILSSVPLLDFKMRAHFSFFSEDVDSYRDFGPPAELGLFDYGLAVTGGIGFGLFHPYVGLGLGQERFRSESDEPILDFSENSIYWNLYGGLRLPILPLVSPFVEYRFTRLMGADEIDYNHNSRLAFGVTLNF